MADVAEPTVGGSSAVRRALKPRDPAACGEVRRGHLRWRRAARWRPGTRPGDPLKVFLEQLAAATGDRWSRTASGRWVYAPYDQLTGGSVRCRTAAAIERYRERDPEAVEGGAIVGRTTQRPPARRVVRGLAGSTPSRLCAKRASCATRSRARRGSGPQDLLDEAVRAEVDDVVVFAEPMTRSWSIVSCRVRASIGCWMGGRSHADRVLGVVCGVWCAVCRGPLCSDQRHGPASTGRCASGPGSPAATDAKVRGRPGEGAHGLGAPAVARRSCAAPEVSLSKRERARSRRRSRSSATARDHPGERRQPSRPATRARSPRLGVAPRSPL